MKKVGLMLLSVSLIVITLSASGAYAGSVCRIEDAMNNLSWTAKGSNEPEAREKVIFACVHAPTTYNPSFCYEHVTCGQQNKVYCSIEDRMNGLLFSGTADKLPQAREAAIRKCTSSPKVWNKQYCFDHVACEMI